MARRGNFAGRLYRGEVSIDFVGRQKIWYSISGAILGISVLALVIFGLNFSIDFKGGSEFTFTAPRATVSQIEQTFAAHGVADANAQEVKPIGKPTFWQVQTPVLKTGQQDTLQRVIANTYNVQKGESGVAISSVSASWGSQISDAAIKAMIVFFIVIVIYLSVAFEWRMAAAAFVA